MSDLLRLLERAALDGHTVLPRAVVLGAVPLPALEDAMSAGTVVADDFWVALESLATAEGAVADEIVGLAEEGRIAIVLGDVPPEAAVHEVHVISDVHRMDLEQVAAELQQVPDEARVVVSGDPDELPGSAPGAVLRDLLAWGALPVRDLRPAPAADEGTALDRLPAALRRGELPPPDPDDRSLVVTRCADDDELVHRVSQLVTDSIPRVFGLSGEQILVVTPLHRGAAGQNALSELLAATKVEVVLAHDLDGRRADAVVACFPAQAAGVLSRALVYSTLCGARRHVSVVTAAGDALPNAVADPSLRARMTRLGSLLASGSPDSRPTADA